MTTHQLMLGATPTAAPPPSPADPYFDYVTMLLHGDGTNGAQNNTFIDSSTNNFTITRNGNTTQGSFSPFGENWSVYFGTNNYLTYTTSSISGAFTIEAWVNFATMAATPTSFYPIFGYSVNATQNMNLRVKSATNIALDNGVSGFDFTVPTLQVGVWYHIVCVRNSSNIATIFVNGVRSSTGTLTITAFPLNTTNSIGRHTDTSGSYYFPGYISNARIISGNNVYDPTQSTITVPSTPLVAVNKTILLSCQSPRFIDNSANNFTLTATGTPSVQRFSPFGPVTLPTPYYSGWFDGNGDYLQLPSSSPAMGSGSFTLECWIYPQSTAATNKAIYGWRSGNDTSPYLFLSSTNVPTFGGDITNYLVSSTAVTVNTWNHIAVVRSGTSMAIFLNGSRVGTGTSSQNFSFSSGTDIGVLNGASPYYFTGCISNLRQVTGTAVYDPTQTSITIPTSPLTAISGTSLLTCQSNQFIDNSANNFTITVNGNAQPKQISPFTLSYSTDQAYSTSVIGGSGYFDGNGDYLTAPANAAFAFGTGNFTVEAWINVSSVAAASQAIFDNRISGTSSTGFYFGLATSTIQIYSQGVINLTGGAITANNWTHVAVTRSGTTIRLFVNGAQVASTTNSTNWTDNNSIIGIAFGATTPITGYISNLRVIKGTALYTSAFAPSNAPFTAVTNTSLLTNFTNAGIFDNAEMNDLETVGNAQISTSVVKFGTGSLAFDGSGDWLTCAASPNLQFGTGSFTIECFFYATALSGSINKVIATNGVNNGFSLFISTGNAVTFSQYGVSTLMTSSVTVTTNTWYHVAVTRSGTSMNIYLNGTSVASTTSSANFISAPLFIGGNGNFTTDVFTGYLDEVRFTKGLARYTTNFTPPTAAFPNY